MASSPAPGNWVDSTDTQGGVVRSYLKWTNTSATSPTFPLSASEAFTSVTYSGTGILTVVMQNACNQFLKINGDVIQASYNASTGACRVRQVSQTPSTGTFVVTLENAAGTAVAGATGDIIELEVVTQQFHSQMG